MEFNSLIFVMLILPVFAGLMFFIKDNKTRNILLLLFSFFFYAAGGVTGLRILIPVIVLTYFTAKNVKKNKTLYIAYLIAVVAVLCFFKYGNTLIEAFGKGDVTELIMPLGISFFTFTAIAYVSDCYYGKIKADDSFLNVCLYLSFFPTIVSGPILRYKPFKKYLEKKTISTDTLAEGFRLFIRGLGKKVLFANQLAIISSAVYGEEELSVLLAWYGALAYMMQIYFDFSGYSDMAIGIAKMVGFEIPENFNYPYLSKTPQEFWQRWHISLSSWFKDYVYIPLGGNRVKTGRWVLNMMIVWLLTGIWHGSTFNFVLWGIYNGLVLIIYRFIFPKRKKYNFFDWLFTMAYAFIGWIIFRVSSFMQLKAVLKGLLGLGIKVDMAYIQSLDILYLIPYFVLAFIFCFPVFDIFKKKTGVLYDILLVLILFLSLFYIVSGSYSSFIYFSF